MDCLLRSDSPNPRRTWHQFFHGRQFSTVRKRQPSRCEERGSRARPTGIARQWPPTRLRPRCLTTVFDPTRAAREAWMLATLPRALAYATSLLRDRTLGEDVVHDCYVRLLEKSDTYNLLSDGTKLLYKAITRACVDRNYRDRRLLSLEVELDGEAEGNGAGGGSSRIRSPRPGGVPRAGRGVGVRDDPIVGRATGCHRVEEPRLLPGRDRGGHRHQPGPCRGARASGTEGPGRAACSFPGVPT